MEVGLHTLFAVSRNDRCSPRQSSIAYDSSFLLLLLLKLQQLLTMMMMMELVVLSAVAY
jgi:hypothetical protein